jgi:dethiobiotin synthetase
VTAPLLVVTGTGTGIGKTAIATAFVAARAGRGGMVAGIKPVESGVTAEPPAPGESIADARRRAALDVTALGQVSTFHVTRFPPPYLFASPVSPHLAARREGRTIDLAAIARWVADIREHADRVVLELPGGLYSPLSATATNATLLRAFGDAKAVLIAPDRLGVLHEVIATTRAARADGIVLDGIVLSAPAEPDDSTGTNADELRLTAPAVPVLATLPRAPRQELVALLGPVLDALDF